MSDINSLIKALEQMAGYMGQKEVDGLGDEESSSSPSGIKKTIIEIKDAANDGLDDLGEAYDEMPGMSFGDKAKAAVENGKRGFMGAVNDASDAAEDTYDSLPGVGLGDKAKAMFENGKRNAEGWLIDAGDEIDPAWMALKKKIRGE